MAGLDTEAFGVGDAIEAAAPDDRDAAVAVTPVVTLTSKVTALEMPISAACLSRKMRL